jgi:chromosomal replication initiation ATPase DnaA
MARGTAPRQLALALGHSESLAREDFLEGPSNADALALIERWPDWPSRAVALVGPEGSGKSHLASIWANAAGARFISAHALEEANLPAALATGALVVEDVVPATGERALFHLLNLARADDAYLLLTARIPPVQWPVGLPDLASRLRHIVAVNVAPPDDVLLRAVLVKLFTDRQIKVDESLIAYLAARIERSFAAARAAVATLDREALRRKRPLTRALAAEVFRDGGTGDGDPQQGTLGLF